MALRIEYIAETASDEKNSINIASALLADKDLTIDDLDSISRYLTIGVREKMFVKREEEKNNGKSEEM
jgi:hypothetical protein